MCFAAVAFLLWICILCVKLAPHNMYPLIQRKIPHTVSTWAHRFTITTYICLFRPLE